ncbi:hypothetical protein PIB30_100508, partial [Stylosanthes scabra]|nr:hypothetical protein [Stylosanthes scabra]
PPKDTFSESPGPLVALRYSVRPPPLLATTIFIQPVLPCFYVLHGPLRGPLHHPPAVARHHRLHLTGYCLVSTCSAVFCIIPSHCFPFMVTGSLFRFVWLLSS